MSEAAKRKLVAVELPVATGAEAARLVRAMGKHRYAAGRLHLVHAFAVEALRHEEDPALAEAFTWSREVLGDASIDASSRDERLWRGASDAEVAAVLEGYWRANSRRSRAGLEALLRTHEIDTEQAAPFDEAHEDEIFPVLVDAGWELLSLQALDPERHKGAIAAFGEPILFQSARFEEGNAHDPPTPYLQELPALGPAELLRATDDAGVLVEPLVLWANGPEAYQDYVLRGVLRAARLADAP